MKTDEGFVALISVLILSFVLLVAVLSLTQFGITSRFFLLDLENKTASEQLAAACVQVATVAITNDPSYNGTDVEVNVDDEMCTIVSVTTVGNESTIKSSAEVSGATTNIEAVWNQTSESITSWKEVVSH